MPRRATARILERVSWIGSARDEIKGLLLAASGTAASSIESTPEAFLADYYLTNIAQSDIARCLPPHENDSCDTELLPP